MWQQIIGKAMQGVGAGLQLGQSMVANRAMWDALSKQLKEQSGYRTEATTGTLMPYVQGWDVDKTNQALLDATGARQNSYNANYSLPASASSLDLGYLQNRGGARAANASYGDWLTQKDLDTTRVQQAIQRIISKAGGSAEVFPYMLNKASNKLAWLNALGMMLRQAGGQVEGASGGGGGGMGGMSEMGSMFGGGGMGGGGAVG